LSFFESEVVRAELAEISQLQEEIYANMFRFSLMEDKEKFYHIELLEKLLSKQKVMYTRIQLTDSDEMDDVKEHMRQSAAMMGLPENFDINVIFNNMEQHIVKMKNYLTKN